MTKETLLKISLFTVLMVLLVVPAIAATDTLYDGTVTLSPGDTFQKAAVCGEVFTISETTPLGVSHATGFSYTFTDKKYAEYGYLLLDDIGSYPYTGSGKWLAYVNEVHKDGWLNTADGLNIWQLENGDTVEYYYAPDQLAHDDPTNYTAVKAAAMAEVRAVVSTGSEMTILYRGTVNLTPLATFDQAAFSSGVTYTVNETTPLGALLATGLSYNVTDRNFASSGTLLLDNVSSYPRNETDGTYWYAYVNDVYRDGWNNPAGGLNLIGLAGGDKVEYYYAMGITDPANLTAVKNTATAAVKTVASIEPLVITDVLYDGTVTLTPYATYDQDAYNTGATYTVNETTPLGALHATGLTYDVTDKNYAASGSLLLDNVGSYRTNRPGYWYAYVNDVYKDGLNNPAGGLNLIGLADGDEVEYYYAAGITDPTSLATVKASATAAVRTVARIHVLKVLYDGTVTLTTGATFDHVAYNSGTTYTINETTPLGALQATALTYNITDKNYADYGTLLVDDIDKYSYDDPGKWYTYVNNVYRDGWNNPAGGLNLIGLAEGDRVEYYYVKSIADKTNHTEAQEAATAAVRTVASIHAPVAPLAAFTSDVTTGNAPLTVTFTDASTNSPATWAWDFGDGNSTNATVRNPVHTYATAGTYTVNLTATNDGGSDSEEKNSYITVTNSIATLPGQTSPPTDPDNDGLYEDMSGNGKAGYTDVVLFFKNIEWIKANEPIAAFDFNGSGGIGFQDIVVLFKELP